MRPTGPLATEGTCPALVDGAPAPARCPILTCLHHSGVGCGFADQPGPGDMASICAVFQTDPVSVSSAIADIQVMTVADRWHEHVTGFALSMGSVHSVKHALSPALLDSFCAWNTSGYSWNDVHDVLESTVARMGQELTG